MLSACLSLLGHRSPALPGDQGSLLSGLACHPDQFVADEMEDDSMDILGLPVYSLGRRHQFCNPRIAENFSVAAACVEQIYQLNHTFGRGYPDQINGLYSRLALELKKKRCAAAIKESDWLLEKVRDFTKGQSAVSKNSGFLL